MGTRMRPEGSSSGWVRVNQPMREKYSSSAFSICRLARSARGPVSAAAAPANSLVNDAMSFGMRTMLSWNSQSGGPDRLLVVGGDTVLHECRLPLMRDDQRPKKQEPLPRIQKQNRVGLREAGRVGQREGRGPLVRGVIPARGLDQNVVRRTFAGTVEPAHQQISVGQFHDRRGVVVPLLQRKNQFTGKLRRGKGRAKREQQSSNRSHHRDKYNRCAIAPLFLHRFFTEGRCVW